MNKHFLNLYNLEEYLFKNVREKFEEQHYLSAYDFFCIVIWKANRAKSNIAKKLLKFSPKSSLDEIVKQLTNKIYKADLDKDKLKVLIEEYAFNLPMASAILTVLYPVNFTVYDIRVCESLGKYHSLANKSIIESIWPLYSEYVEEVKSKSKAHTLRENDRILWAQSFHQQLESDIAKNFKNEKAY